jgi:hypothetical protein
MRFVNGEIRASTRRKLIARGNLNFYVDRYAPKIQGRRGESYQEYSRRYMSGSTQSSNWAVAKPNQEHECGKHECTVSAESKRIDWRT